jgi:hypothetical protein
LAKVRGSASHEIESMFVTAFFIKKITFLNKIILLAVFLRLKKKKKKLKPASNEKLLLVIFQKIIF